MKTRLLIIIGIIFLTSIVIISFDNDIAHGLECRPSNMTRSIEQADVVFSGQAISKEYLGSSDRFTLVGVTLFSITESFKGVYQDTVKISSDERLWGANFTEGSKYVVFGYNDGTDIKHQLCTPTSLVEHADIELIRKISKEYVLSPLKQFNLKVSIDKIQCKTSLELISKHDGSPACVKPESIPKLVERGWINDNKIENKWDVSYYPNKRPLPNGQFDTNLENVIPWLMMKELEKQGIKNWKNDPSTGAHTDEGWLNPSKMCSSLFVDAKTKIYISTLFYSEPELAVSEIIIDGSKPTDCQKWFFVPYGVDSKTGNLLYGYDEKSPREHYEIDIIGLKDEYVLGEEYSFYFVISGYGSECASYVVSYPDESGYYLGEGAYPLCDYSPPLREFEINYLDIKGTLGNISMKNPGSYVVTVTFDKPSHYFPTTVSKEFRVIEN